MSIQEKIAKNITAARKDKNYSQEQLAVKADIDRSNYAKIEKGTRNFRIATLDKIAQALEIDIEILFK